MDKDDKGIEDKPEPIEEDEKRLKEFENLFDELKLSKKEEKEEAIDKQLNRTDRDQAETQDLIELIFTSLKFATDESESYPFNIPLMKKLHFDYAKKMIPAMPGSYAIMENGYPWFPYWILNIIEMCKDEQTLSHAMKMKFVAMLKELQHKEGGFMGTTQGQAHLVTSYGALMAIANLGIKEAYDIVDIPKMRKYILRMKNSNVSNKHPAVTDLKGKFLITRLKESNCSSSQIPWPGSFMSQYNGESDLRATYAALTMATVLNIMDEEIAEGVTENIAQCQTFEGGFGPEPYCEAHGGYSYCGIASLLLLNKLNAINVDNFLHWLVNRQMIVEGGFNGRTNKLVDSCYSFWQGSIFNLLLMGDKKFSIDSELLYDQLSLQAYILMCCQSSSGGLFDKPSKYPDLFHTNYAIAGLSCSQKSTIDREIISLSGSMGNYIPAVNPIYCVLETKIQRAIKYYRTLTPKK